MKNKNEFTVFVLFEDGPESRPIYTGISNKSRQPRPIVHDYITAYSDNQDTPFSQFAFKCHARGVVYGLIAAKLPSKTAAILFTNKFNSLTCSKPLPPHPGYKYALKCVRVKLPHKARPDLVEAVNTCLSYSKTNDTETILNGYNPNLLREFKTCRNRALKTGQIFSLDMTQYFNLVSKPCSMCGDYGAPDCLLKINDESKGYVYENCIPLCRTCHKMIGDNPYHFFIHHIAKITAKQSKETIDG